MRGYISMAWPPGAAAPPFWTGLGAFGWGSGRRRQAAVLRGAARNATRSRASGAGRARTGSCAARPPRLPRRAGCARLGGETASGSRRLPVLDTCLGQSVLLVAARPPAGFGCVVHAAGMRVLPPRHTPVSLRPLPACGMPRRRGDRRGAAWRIGPQGGCARLHASAGLRPAAPAAQNATGRTAHHITPRRIRSRRDRDATAAGGRAAQPVPPFKNSSLVGGR